MPDYTAVREAVTAPQDRQPSSIATGAVGRIGVDEIRIGNIPAVIRAHKQWLTWRDDKRPVQNWQSDPDSLMTCEEALKLAKREGYGGIGYRFSAEAGLMGFDLDHCVGENGKPNAIAVAILGLLDSYTELSVSRTGLHVIFPCSVKPRRNKGSIVMRFTDKTCEAYDPRNKAHDDPSLYLKQTYECYVVGRYFTMTGTFYDEKRCDLKDMSVPFQRFLDKFQPLAKPVPEAPKQSPPLGDVEGVADVDRLRGALSAIPSDDYDVWFRVGRALKTASAKIGDSVARGLYETWSDKSDKYNPRELDGKWTEPSDDRITPGTIYHLAREHGWDGMALSADGRRYRAERGLPPVYFDADASRYIRQADDGQWITENETQCKATLAVKFHVSRKAEVGQVSDADRLCVTIRSRHNVSYAGPLAGWRGGIYEEGGRRMIVTDSPPTLDADKAFGQEVRPPKLLAGIFRTLFGGDRRQAQTFLSWLAVARRCLDAQTFRPGQVLVLCGAANCGKSLLQHIITQVVGGRAANPFQYMSGDTTFNADLVGAEHLMMEDVRSTSDIRSRREFGSQIKTITACDAQRVHAKGRDALTLRPFWRASLSINDEPENLAVLPPLDDSILDKLILLKCQPAVIPMPTGTTEERAALWAALMAEMRGLVEFLRSWQIPEEIVASRYGVSPYCHQHYKEALDDMNPETLLMQLIERHMASMNMDEWLATATDVRASLIEDHATCYDARSLLQGPKSCGTYLGRLARRFPDRVRRPSRDTSDRSWIIGAPPKTDLPMARQAPTTQASEAAVIAAGDEFLA